MIRYKCGCVNEVHGPSGVLRSVSKCPGHERRRSDPSTLAEKYYKVSGIIGGPHLEQIRDALGPFPAARGGRRALEIGCGASPYAGAIKAAGWAYEGLDRSRWAVNWTARRWDVAAHVADWGHCPVYVNFHGLVLAAHVLEHLEDAPRGLADMAETLEPGGELWLIVPDDSDPVNPDHLFFFNQDTLTRCAERVGLEVEAFAVRKYIERESFLYCRARKPA